MSTNASRTPSPRPDVLERLIVARDHAGLCQALREAVVARGKFTVIVDRRKEDRRQRVQPVREERRCAERRSLPAIATDPRRWPYVLVRERHR